MSAKSIIIIVTAVLAALLEILDVSIVNVAIPTMMGNIGATLDEISWVSTGYMIANSIILPVAAWFVFRLGRKRYFTGAILVFTLASLACGLAPNLTTLVIFRIIQGLAGGALLPTSQTLIQEQFPKEKATLAMAIFGMSVMIGPALGPVLGGYLTDHIGWRAIFNVNIPIGLLAAFMSYLYVDSGTSQVSQPSADQKDVKKSVDWAGFILLALTVGCFQYILERGQREGWMDSNAIRISAFFAVTGFISFIYWELKTATPIMNLRLFKTNVVSAGAILMMALGIILYALTFVVPILVDQVMHMTATQTGALFFPGAVAAAITMMSIGMFSKYVHPRVLILTGIAFAGTSVVLMSRFTIATGSDGLFFPLLFRGIATALMFVPITGVVMGSFRGQELEQVSGMMNFFRQMGGSIGIASLSTLTTRFGKQNYSDLMAKVSILSPSGYQQFTNATHHFSSHTLYSNVGMGDPWTFAIQTMWARTMQQSFIMSFDQICSVILFIVAGMLIPLFLMKMDPQVKTDVSAH